MSWWRRLLHREPPAPRGRHHAVPTALSPAELIARMTGMLDAYVPPDPGGPAGDTEPLEPPAPLTGQDPAAGRADPMVASAEDEGSAQDGERTGVGTVVLCFADGSSVALAPDDARTTPFLTLTDVLTSR